MMWSHTRIVKPVNPTYYGKDAVDTRGQLEAGQHKAHLCRCAVGDRLSTRIGSLARGWGVRVVIILNYRVSPSQQHGASFHKVG